jgi:hypothetical protein
MRVFVILLTQEAEGLITPIVLWSCLDCAVEQGYVCLIVWLLRVFRSQYPVYCLYVNVHCTTATGCQLNCS